MESENIVKIARKITAGVMSNDYDEGIDSLTFAQEFKVKMDKAIETFVNGFAMKGTNYTADCYDGTIPAILISPPVEKSHIEGKYTAAFKIFYQKDDESGEANSLRFNIAAAIDKDGEQIWQDVSEYTAHVNSLAGEAVSIRKFNNGFIIDSIDGYNIGEFMSGRMIIDQFGVGKASFDADESLTEQIKNDNFAFLKEKVGEITSNLTCKIQTWEQSNHITGSIAADIKRNISDDSKNIQ